MSINRTNWEQSWQYQRILEILEDYWVNCPDEAFVEVDMYFRKVNGEEQLKEITWQNPNFKRKESSLSDTLLCAADIISKPEESFYHKAVKRADKFMADIV